MRYNCNHFSPVYSGVYSEIHCCWERHLAKGPKPARFWQVHRITSRREGFGPANPLVSVVNLCHVEAWWFKGRPLTVKLVSPPLLLFYYVASYLRKHSVCHPLLEHTLWHRNTKHLSGHFFWCCRSAHSHHCLFCSTLVWL